MDAPHQTIHFHCTGEAAAQAAAESLRRRGLRVARSFDLRSAVAAGVDCGCPHHGTDLCTCQMVVLLVYGETGLPAVITAHSRGPLAAAQIANDANAQPDPRLVEQVLAALREAALNWEDLARGGG